MRASRSRRVVGVSLAAGVLLAAAPAVAQVDREGPAQSGANDAAATAQRLGTLTSQDSLTVQGWISNGNPNDVDFYRFEASGGSAYLDVDFAEDARVADDFDEGLDPAIWVFDPSGALVAFDDDSDFFEIGASNQGTDPGSDPFADHDSFVGPLPLGSGSYTVAVSFYPNTASALGQPGLGLNGLASSGLAVTGASPDAAFALGASCADPQDRSLQCAGPYQLQIRRDFLGLVDAEGPASSGPNDAAALAQPMGVLSDNGSLTAYGWISSVDENEVDFWSFTVPGGGTTAHLDIDFAEDVHVPADVDRGLDPALWLFDGSGALVAYDDDSDFFDPGLLNAGTDPGSDPYADHDSFLGELLLPAGTYYAAVAYWENSANGSFQPGLGVVSLSRSGRVVSGASPDTSFERNITCVGDPADPEFQCTGPYQLQVRTRFLPEPAGGATAAGLGLAALAARRLARGRDAGRREAVRVEAVWVEAGRHDAVA
jgi:hypothetical protein